MSPPSVHLPVELIEEILSVSPVKSVLRFKSVCKQWHAIISDPRFSRIHHIRRSKLLENQNTFVVWKRKRKRHSSPGLCLNLVRLEEDGRKLTAVSEFHHQYYSRILCSCNGIFLLTDDNHGSFMLWNPYIRKSTMIITTGTPSYNHLYLSMYNLYHDEISDDYKIVFDDMEKYSVYSCKNRSWGEMLDFPCDLPSLTDRDTSCATVDGCFYELRFNSEEIVFLDVRDGKVDKFPQPNYDHDHVEEEEEEVRLEAISGRLCLSSHTYNTSGNIRFQQLWVMERNENLECCWRKLMSRDMDKHTRLFRSMWLSNEDDVVIGRFDNESNLSTYNCVEKRFHKDMELDWNDRYFPEFFQYQENLYMPT